ncbi:hypothetical protein E2C01_042868 [Portunus trituberculatus]|uniref:Uncharacterized protein n=1 Tax=Portunus trituberculatus TaxID=210409 RepID=A0A5B7FUJ5_PORTR|nr:hypothetical protein [Portunus trituberculatus]
MFQRRLLRPGLIQKLPYTLVTSGTGEVGHRGAGALASTTLRNECQTLHGVPPLPARPSLCCRFPRPLSPGHYPTHPPFPE